MAKKFESKIGLKPVYSTKDPLGNPATKGEELAQSIRDNYELIEKNIASAQTTADTAASNATKAQSTANTAVTNVATAQTTANTAVTNAATALATAEAASKAMVDYKTSIDDWLKNSNTTIKILRDGDTIGADGEYLIIEDGSVTIVDPKNFLISPSKIMRGFTTETNGSLLTRANNYATTGLIPVSVGDVLNISGNTVGISMRVFSANKTLLIEVPTPFSTYTIPANAVYIALNDNSGSSVFVTIIRNTADAKTITNTNAITYIKIGNGITTSYILRDFSQASSIINTSWLSSIYNFTNKQNARNHVEQSIRRGGQIITYQMSSGEWILEQFVGQIGSGSGDTVLMTPSKVFRGYTTEADGTLKSQAANYATTGLVPVIQGNHIYISGKTIDSIRLFNSSKTLVNTLTGITSFIVPPGVAYISLNDNTGSVTFCSITMTVEVNSWYDNLNWLNLSQLSDQIFEQSKFNIRLDIDDFEGVNDIIKVNTAIEFANRSGGGIVEIKRNISIQSAILMRSNVYLLFYGKIKLADGVFDNIIRSNGVIIDPANPNDKCLALEEISNIKIIGIGENAAIEGPDIPYKGTNPKTKAVEPFIGDYFGWRTIGILLSNVKDYEVGNFFMSKTTCWAISQEWGCENGHIHDIKFNTTVKNGDGVDFRNGCKNILVENITGNTSDDTIACTALDNTVMSNPSYVWVLQTMGFEYRTGLEAGIFDISIKNINSISQHNIVRCLASSPKVQRISVSDIYGTPSGNALLIGTGYGTGFVKGNLANIYGNNISRSNTTAPINASKLVDSWFNKIKGTISIVDSENVKVTNNT